MNILATIKREERKLEKQMTRLQHQLEGLRTAAKVLSNSTSNGFAKVEKRVISATARANMSRAAKKRWAKMKAQGKKALT